MDPLCDTWWHQQQLFTPKHVDPAKCQARIWAGGIGGQCSHTPEDGRQFCRHHSKDKWKVHGVVTGPIPEEKLSEFQRVAARAGHGVGSSTATELPEVSDTKQAHSELPKVSDTKQAHSERLLVGRYRIEFELQATAHSRVYHATDCKDGEKRKVAVKVEVHDSRQRPRLGAEYDALCGLTGGSGIPRILAYAQFDEVAQGSVLVLELLGEDLRLTLLKRRKLSPPTAAFLGLQMLSALKTVHTHGLLHRDVKPGNFCFGRKYEDRLKLYIIDFGLVRRHLNANQRPRRRRPQTAFRGTTHYASIAAQSFQDLGRVDDLWSLCYVVVEMVAGGLPWDGVYAKAVEDEEKAAVRQRVLDEKKLLVGALTHSNPYAVSFLQNSAKFLESLPESLVDALRMLSQMTYESRPDYAGLRCILLRMGNGTFADCKRSAEKELLGDKPELLSASCIRQAPSDVDRDMPHCLDGARAHCRPFFAPAFSRPLGRKSHSDELVKLFWYACLAQWFNYGSLGVKMWEKVAKR